MTRRKHLVVVIGDKIAQFCYFTAYAHSRTRSSFSGVSEATEGLERLQARQRTGEKRAAWAGRRLLTQTAGALIPGEATRLERVFDSPKSEYVVQWIAKGVL